MEEVPFKIGTLTHLRKGPQSKEQVEKLHFQQKASKF